MTPFFKAKHQIGRFGEILAEKFLLGKGYSLIDRNFRIQGGEIDLVFEHQYTLVFVEVKTRSSNCGFGTPEEGFTTRQKQKLIRAVYFYNEKMQYFGNWRLDLIAITIFSGVRAEIKHHKNILED